MLCILSTLSTHVNSLSVGSVTLSGIYPEVPAPAGGETRLRRARETRPEQREPALIQEMHREIHLWKILEQLARLAPRVDARQGVARAVRVAAQELARREVLRRVLLETRGVLAQALHRLARQTMREAQARLRPQQTRARAPEQADVDAVVVGVAVVKHHDRPPARREHAMHLAYGRARVRRVVQHAVRVDEVEALVCEL